MATINVSTFLELKNAIEDSTSTEIIVTQDIVFSAGGARVNTAKGNIVIDFGGYKITDNDTSVMTEGIYIPENSPAIVVTAKNATWNGRSTFGVIGVSDNNDLVTISLEGLNFKGPRLAYNKNGITKIIDCEIVIDKNNGSANPLELCEGNRVIIDGQVTVNSNSQANAVISFSGANSSLTVEEDGVFEVNSLYTHFLYTNTSPALLFKKNSTTFINTKNGLFFGEGATAHIASSFTLEEGGVFSATQNEANSVPMFKCLTDFSLGLNSTFALYSPSTGTTPLVYFGGKANINISSPKSVVLYNNGGSVFSFQTGDDANPNVINLTAEMLHLWNVATVPVASAGGLDDRATENYHKAYYIDEFTANFELSSSQVLSASSNLQALDEGYPISIDIPLLTCQVLSLGKITLVLDDINDLSTMISGETTPYANARATFDTFSKIETAGNNGWFSIPLDRIIPVRTRVLLELNKDFLTKSLAIISEGSLAITKLPQLDFWAFTRKPESSTIYRVKTDWEIEVTDTRTVGEDWFLYAYIDDPLMSDRGVLVGALRYKNATAIPLSSTPMLIHSGKWSDTNRVTKISWEKMKGFLLNVDTNQTYTAGRYTTYLHWILTTDRMN